jgi:tetrapyrrole methylase family protein/MazG family protein
MYTITVVPLSVPHFLTEASRQAILHTKKLFLQTAQHPCSKWVIDEGLPFVSMDDLYETSEDFDALNLSIAKRLLCGENAVYAVLGRGAGQAFLTLLRLKAEKENANIVCLPGIGFTEAALSALPMGEGTFDAYTASTANALPSFLDTNSALCIEQIDTAMRAGEVKLALGEFYPDAAPVWVCTLNQSGFYEAKKIALYELDRQKAYAADTVVVVPPVRFEALERHGLEGLLYVLDRLRAPGGCPWDAEQTHESLRRSAVEEAYEVVDAIDHHDDTALCEELGDLLLQVAFHARIGSERSAFTMRDITTGIVQKLIYRHPHVFAKVHVSGTDEVLVNWEKLKSTEKGYTSATSAMEAVPKSFPALMRGAKVQKKAANVGFDWNNADDALHKIYEEADELHAAIDDNESAARLREEMGDLLFSAVNVARLLKIDPEEALKDAVDKFIARFSRMEARILEDGKQIESMTLTEMDAYWDKIKK